MRRRGTHEGDETRTGADMESHGHPYNNPIKCLSAAGERGRIEQETGAEGLQELQREQKRKVGGATERHRKRECISGISKRDISKTTQSAH